MEPEAGQPEFPMWLDPEAKEIWNEMTGILAGLGVLTKIDGNALARYCHAWMRWKKAAAFIDKNGEFFKISGPEGELKGVAPWPQVAIYQHLSQILVKLEIEFGLTPASRSSIRTAGSSKQNRGLPAFKLA